MNLILPLYLANKVVKHLKFDEVDCMIPATLTEYWAIKINFTQRSYYIKPSWKSSTEEDIIFGELLLTI